MRRTSLVSELRKALTEPVIRGSHHVLMREAADVLERLQSPRETECERWDPVKQGGPMPTGLRFDVLGWACSVCGAWCSEDDDFCAHPNRSAEKSNGQPVSGTGGCPESLRLDPHYDEPRISKQEPLT